MGMVYADIELINGEDLMLARRNIIGQDEIKRIPLNILVDTGAYYLCINETIQEYLNLPFIESRRGQLANGIVADFDVVGPVEVKFQNRRCNVDAMLIKGDDVQPLLGAIPLEDLDVIVHPLEQELVVNPKSPDKALMKLMQCI